MDVKKEAFLDHVEDAVSNLCYYDRKNDEELSSDDVRELLESETVTMDEIIARIKKTLNQNFRMPS